MHALNKGKAGEREAAKWLHQWLSLTAVPERNLEQTRNGGHDLTGVGQFAVEVKRCETLALAKWWRQASKSGIESGLVPVVMFRQNRKKWKFLISANTIGVEHGFLELTAETFILWANLRLTR